MSALITSSHVRQAIRSSSKVRHASTAIQQRAEPQHGEAIYVYNHLQTNQVVYSLTRAMKNNASLKQLPFNGKKTVPAALRKDLWSPFATISFPAGSQSVGLSAYQKLREYRRLHELSWDDSLMTDEEGKSIPRKKRGRQISDQKANTVADIATVLGKIGTPEGEAIGLKSNPDTETPVEVRWTNVQDAEFAQTWSENVVHDTLEWEKNHRDLSTTGLSAEEKEERQRAYWTEMERKMVEHYASKGKTPPSEKSFNQRIQESLARSEAHRARQERTALRKEAEQEAKANIRAGTEEEIAAKKEQKAIEQEAIQEKQKLYLAEMEQKRLEWYASEGKTPPSEKGYATQRVVTEEEVAARIKQRDIKKAETREKKKLQLAEREQNKLEQEASKAKTPPPEKGPTKPSPEIEEKQKAYLAEMERKRLEWYASQGKTPPPEKGYVKPSSGN